MVDASSHGVEVGLVVNPDQSLDEFEHWFDRIKHVLVMRVNPGFAGQAGIDTVDEKIAQIRVKYPDVNITADGAISAEVLSRLADIGVQGFVLGTSALFRKPDSYETILKSLAAGK